MFDPVALLSVLPVQYLPHLQGGSQGDKQAVVVAKFLELLYHNVKVFRQQVATSQEFTDSLAATLFPPSSIIKLQEGEDNEDDEVCPLTRLNCLSFQW